MDTITELAFYRSEKMKNYLIFSMRPSEVFISIVIAALTVYGTFAVSFGTPTGTSKSTSESAADVKKNKPERNPVADSEAPGYGLSPK